MRNPLTPPEQHRANLLAVTKPVCGWPFPHDCRGPLRADHPIPRQSITQRVEAARIRRQYFDDKAFPTDARVLEVGRVGMIADARNGWWLCDEAHNNHRHGAYDDHEIGADYTDFLPPSVWEFAREFGFSYSPGYGWHPDSTIGAPE